MLLLIVVLVPLLVLVPLAVALVERQVEVAIFRHVDIIGTSANCGYTCRFIVIRYRR